MLYSQNTTKQTIVEQMQLLNEKEAEAVLVFIKNLLRKDSPEEARKKAEVLQPIKNLQAEAEEKGLTQDILDQIVRNAE